MKYLFLKWLTIVLRRTQQTNKWLFFFKKYNKENCGVKFSHANFIIGLPAAPANSEIAKNKRFPEKVQPFPREDAVVTGFVMDKKYPKISGLLGLSAKSLRELDSKRPISNRYEELAGIAVGLLITFKNKRQYKCFR